MVEHESILAAELLRCQSQKAFPRCRAMGIIEHGPRFVESRCDRAQSPNIARAQLLAKVNPISANGEHHRDIDKVPNWVAIPDGSGRLGDDGTCQVGAIDDPCPSSSINKDRARSEQREARTGRFKRHRRTDSPDIRARAGVVGGEQIDDDIAAAETVSHAPR